MGVEVMGVTQVPVKEGVEVDSTYVAEKDNRKLDKGLVPDEPIKFGSHETDVPVKVEAAAVKDTNLPKDAVEDWPAPKQIHSFYFVKVRSYDDPKIKTKLDLADRELQKKNQARFQITEALKAKRSERANVISQLKPLSVEDRRYRTIVDGKRKEMEPLTQALGKLRSANNANREKGYGVCSSEEELNDLIHSLNYRIQHESNTLVEEKQLLREIKQLEGSRSQVIANAAMKAKIQDSLGQKEDIQDQVKLIGGDLDGVRKEQQAIRSKIRSLEDERKAIEDEISSLQDELTTVSLARDKAYENLVELRKQREGGNTCFYQNRSLLNNARELAAKKDIAALEELSQKEVENFMSMWSSNKSFRDDYEKRILSSLDMRQLSRDGRMRNPDEKPLVSEPPKPAEPEVVAKPITKRPKEETKPLPKKETIPAPKVEKEVTKNLTELENKAKSNGLEEKEELTFEKPQKEAAVKPVIDEAKLKEIKREEEIAKAKMALERKKKLAEKAAAKAAIRAQKEAEKKLKEKEREKKSKKKAAPSDSPLDTEEQTESPADTDVVENSSDSVEAAPLQAKGKEQEKTITRYRNRSRGQNPPPRVMMKPPSRKRTPYWQYAGAAAVLALLLAIIGYYYLL